MDPELGETGRPELAGNINLRWSWRRLGVDWRSQYLGGMLLAFLTIKSARTLYGDAVFMDATWVHGLNVRYAMRTAPTLHGGVRNLTAEQPFATARAFFASARGRMLYLRAVIRL